MSETDASQNEGQEPKPATAQKTTETTSTTGIKVFDADYVKELRSENAARRNEVNELKSRIEDFESANASELEKAQSKAAKKEQEAQEALSKLLRHEVADEKQVPVKARKYLTGSTREELEANADELIADFKGSEQTPDFDGGAREPAPEPKSPEQQHNDVVLGLIGIPTD